MTVHLDSASASTLPLSLVAFTQCESSLGGRRHQVVRPEFSLGLRCDYRFLMVKPNDAAPAFFGQSNRFAHSVYAGLIINTSR